MIRANTGALTQINARLPNKAQKRRVMYKVLCPRCRGQRTETCKLCGGGGKRMIECKACAGTGQQPCYVCGGGGEIDVRDPFSRLRSGLSGGSLIKIIDSDQSADYRKQKVTQQATNRERGLPKKVRPRRRPRAVSHAAAVNGIKRDYPE